MTQPVDPAADPRDEPPERLQLSAVQVLGSSAAAVSAAIVCSFFGVAGTVIGTAVTSMVATTGSALYAYSLRRTRTRLRRLHQAGAAAPPVTAVLQTAKGQGTRLFRRIPWRIVLLGTANVFVFSIAFVTGLEGILGRPLPAEFGVSHGGDNSTSLGSTIGSSHHRKSTPSKSPKPTPTTTATTTTSTPTTRTTAPSTHAPTSPSSPPPSTAPPSGLLPTLRPPPSGSASP